MKADPQMSEHPASPIRATNRLESFRHAFAGWRYMLRTQQNAWIHTGFTVFAIALGVWLGVSTQEWAILALAIGIVWMAEFTNTAIEAVVDLASPEIHPLAKIGKDVAAGAVLIGAVTAVVVGLLILGPPLLQRVLAWFS
jgi:diacylglycerol kinase